MVCFLFLRLRCEGTRIRHKRVFFHPKKKRILWSIPPPLHLTHDAATFSISQFATIATRTPSPLQSGLQLPPPQALSSSSFCPLIAVRTPHSMPAAFPICNATALPYIHLSALFLFTHNCCRRQTPRPPARHRCLRFSSVVSAVAYAHLHTLTRTRARTLTRPRHLFRPKNHLEPRTH